MTVTVIQRRANKTANTANFPNETGVKLRSMKLLMYQLPNVRTIATT